jgi:CelD/BcsL family acetyltransferase involved in cellulose biosynthesis
MPVIDVSRPLGGRRWVSLPFTDRCPPLAGANADDLVAGLGVLARSQKLDLLEVRGALAEQATVQRDLPFVHHQVAVAGERQNWDRLAKNHRRNVRIAERADVRIVRGVSVADVETFYRLHLRTRRRLGVPVQPRRFFRLLLETVIGQGLGFVLTAYSGELPVASAVFGAWNGTLIYKYSARDERFAKLDANYLLLWSGIRWATENGYHTFDLGRSNVDQEFLRTFKDGWGAREEPLAYSRISRSPARTHSPRLETAMSVVIRNSAPWVCRTVGELFYRYAT